jgi:hypothetical protein
LAPSTLSYALSRARAFDFGVGDPLRVCCAEDLIVFKAFAARPRDWADIESVIQRQGNRLDWSQILFELEPLVALKEQPEILDKLRNICDHIRAQFPD